MGTMLPIITGLLERLKPRHLHTVFTIMLPITSCKGIIFWKTHMVGKFHPTTGLHEFLQRGLETSIPVTVPTAAHLAPSTINCLELIWVSSPKIYFRDKSMLHWPSWISGNDYLKLMLTKKVRMRKICEHRLQLCKYVFRSLLSPKPPPPTVEG